MWGLFVLVNGILVFSIAIIRYYYNIEERLDELEERIVFR